MSEFSKSAEENIAFMNRILRVEANFDMSQRKMKIAGKTAGFFFVNGFVQTELAEKLMSFFYLLKKEELESVDTFLELGMPYTQVSKADKLEDAVRNFLSGVAILFIDGFDVCICIDCRSYPMRGVTEPWKDRVLRGSRDGFVETLISNVALLRRRIRDTSFSAEILTVGARSRSDVAVCYIADKADKKQVDMLKKRIQSIEVEALTMNIESLAECLFEHRWLNPFPKFKYSERPDTATAAVFDGSVVIMVDNSPAAMIVPASIFDVIEEPDDFNFAPLIGTYLRLSRFLFTIVTLLLTPTWLLLISHPDWIPGWLQFITVSDEITVPVFYQLIILELGVDGLKLAAVNTPTLLSTPLSVVAGIVVGQYAVSSGWFNAETLLYVAVVTVGTYSQASFEMGYAVKFARVVLLCLTSWFELWGYIAGIIFTLACIVFNKTLTGESYIYPLIPFNAELLKRKLFRIRLPHSHKNVP